MKYEVDVRYSFKQERTERVLEIAEAFGLGLNEREFVVFDHAEVEILPGDVVYITGESGGGKSTLLRELTNKLVNDGHFVSNIDQIVFEDKPVIDQIGKSTGEALRLLSIAGLNDANLFIRKPAELSDGQKYRFRIAKMLESGATVWVADEFLAILDRTTAKVLAYNLQKIARNAGAILMVATTHSDMKEDLAPTLEIDKRYREKVSIVRVPKDEGYKDVPTRNQN